MKWLLSRRHPHLIAALGSLVMLGAFTTSIGAGMVFQDWPLSNGPPGSVWIEGAPSSLANRSARRVCSRRIAR